ncbi:MAG: S1 RNA-binding domain-containing protein, partial [Microvirgula sp.]
GAVIALDGDIEGYLPASELSRDRVEDARSLLKEGEEIEALVINVDRKSRSLKLSIKAKDAAEEQGAVSRFQAEANANAGTTNLGALLKAKLSGGNE